jgi:adenylate cyclase
MRLNPYHPDWYLLELGSAFYVTQRYVDAIEAFNGMTRPGFWKSCYLAACFAQMDRMEDAVGALAEALQRRPDFSIAKLRHAFLAAQEVNHFMEGLRKAGLPE